MTAPKARLIAFYLPQFHPIPENDEWWGKGFTEWTNVAKARPLFPGHYQPRVPADLGFYDLRVPETREAQAAMARAHGIEGFCYWHYWFNGKRLLEKPFDQMLATGEPEFPFCLAWANEDWTRTWDGRSSEILQKQEYGGQSDDTAHFDYLLRAFKDQRYMAVDGKPMFLIYRPADLPDPTATIALWRSLARESGLPGLHLVAIRTCFD
ncbi:MAG: glycoside hydrolase family 99-like domain-containing protein, partial [Candidatus Sumerlaeota bacterium]|nr:glycoside hydrolase family 99-like domain-containing protein [Candidatus Sumerlaeota bacterium]